MAKRLAAVGAALALIAGALFVRDRWIDGDGASADSDSVDGRVLVCATEVAAICRTAAADHPGLTVRSASVSDSVVELADDEMWLTFTPFPEVLTQTRSRSQQEEFEFVVDAVASSNLSLVALADRATVLGAECGRPVDWACLGDHTGSDWSTIGGEPTWGRIRPAFAPLDSGIGQLGVAAAVAGYFGDAPINADDPTFIGWGRRVARAVPSSALSAGTAVATIQVRSSLLDVAVGAEAELSSSNTDRFTALTTTPDTRVDLVLAASDRVAVPDGLLDGLRDAAIAKGWLDIDSAGVTGTPPSANTLVTTSRVWEDLT